MLKSLDDFVGCILGRSAGCPRLWPLAAGIFLAVAASGKNLSAQPPLLRGPGMLDAASQAGMPLAPPPTSPGPLPPQQSAHLPGMGAMGFPSAQTQLIRDRGDLDKPLPRQIDRLPVATEKMEVIHRRSQLVVLKQRVTRFAIADPSVIDIVQYSPTELAIVGLEQGSTNLLYWFEGEQEPLIYEVTVIPDPSLEDQRRIDYGRLERKLAILFPNSKVYLIPLSGKIVVKGQARDGEEAAQILQIIQGEIINRDGRLGGPQPVAAQTQLGGLGGAGLGLGLGNGFGLGSGLIVNMLEVPGEYQIMLRVRIAELKRSQLRRMGLNLGGLISNGRNLITSTLGGGGGTLAGIFENGEVSVLLNWLESNGTAKILSEPTLTVLSGHPASFLSGGEFAVPTIVGVGGAQGQTTTFRGYGTSILVIPMVIDRDLIRMRIVPEFSQANQGLSVGGIPGLNSRRVQTTVELREGQTIAIAGLITHQANAEVTRIPFLGEIPVVGPLFFNTKMASQDESELLVLVSPELVRPMDADEVPPVPGYEVTPPNQWELYHAAMTEGAPDTGYYQVPPLGSDSNRGINVPYRLFNPVPAEPQYAPIPNNTYGAVPLGTPLQYQRSTNEYQPQMQAPSPQFQNSPPIAPPPASYPGQIPSGQAAPYTTWQQRGYPSRQGVTPASYQQPSPQNSAARADWNVPPAARRR